MNRISIDKIDLACENPKRSSQFYASIFDIQFEKVVIQNTEHYLGNVGAFQLFLCPKEQANVTDSTSGVHQIHITIKLEMDRFTSHLKDLNIDFQKVNFNPKKNQICISDLDENPWIISCEIEKN